MQIRPTEQTLKGPPERFTGDAWFDMIVAGVEPSRIRSSIVHFAPGARNAWHVHPSSATARSSRPCEGRNDEKREGDEGRSGDFLWGHRPSERGGMRDRIRGGATS